MILGSQSYCTVRTSDGLAVSAYFDRCTRLFSTSSILFRHSKCPCVLWRCGWRLGFPDLRRGLRICDQSVRLWSDRRFNVTEVAHAGIHGHIWSIKSQQCASSTFYLIWYFKMHSSFFVDSGIILRRAWPWQLHRRDSLMPKRGMSITIICAIDYHRISIAKSAGTVSLSTKSVQRFSTLTRFVRR